MLRWTRVVGQPWSRTIRTPATTHFYTIPSEAYKKRVEERVLSRDEAQWRVVSKFMDKLHAQLQTYHLPNIDHEHTTSIMVPRGLYIHGKVGTGKSMLMDLFFETAPIRSKRRVHFNKFMLNVHQRLQIIKKQHLERFGRNRNIVLNDPQQDAITIVATDIVQESVLLCFDEFQVTDVADAMILRKLFGVFFERGGVMVATSNTPPLDLYSDGINREYFMPFLQQLARHTKIVDMASLTDYRRTLPTRSTRPFYYFYSPLSTETEHNVKNLLNEWSSDSSMKPLRVPIMMGRSLNIKGTREGIAYASFADLCETEKGAADYKALCEHFHTLILVQIPRLTIQSHDAARRFILLIDELYEHHTRLVCTSEVPLTELFELDTIQLADEASEAQKQAEKLKQKQLQDSVTHGILATTSWDAPIGVYNPAKMPGLQIQNLCALQDLHISYKRAISRLIEMQSALYEERNLVLRSKRQDQLRQYL